MQMHLTPLSAPILAPPPDSVNANEYILYSDVAGQGIAVVFSAVSVSYG